MLTDYILDKSKHKAILVDEIDDADKVNLEEFEKNL